MVTAFYIFYRKGVQKIPILISEGVLMAHFFYLPQKGVPFLEELQYQVDVWCV